jgi:hypothetical protein
MSNGHSICPLDPMDTRKSNEQLEVHLFHLINKWNVQWLFDISIGHLAWVLDINHNMATPSLNVFVTDPLVTKLLVYSLSIMVLSRTGS